MTTPSKHRAPRRIPTWGSSAAIRIGVAVLVIFALVFAGYGGAFAFVTSTGSGTATATTGTLNPPTAVSGSQTALTSTVVVSWTAPTSGAAPTGYYVLRTPSPSGTTVPVCGTSAASPTVSTTCNDTSVPNGAYTYVVVAVHYSWSAASAPSAVVNVVETTQTITFTSSPSSPTVGGTYLVSATGGGSGNSVTFSSATLGTCTVAGSTVALAHAGNCTINANQAGNAQYNAAPQVQQSFTIAKAPQTISYTTTAPVGAVVGGPGYTPAATGGASGNTVTFSIDPSTSANCSISGGGLVTYQHVGSCTVNANQGGNADYFAAGTAMQSYAIGQGSQAITFTSTAPVNAKVGGTTYNVTATGGASGNAVTFSSGSPSVCTVAGSTVSFVGAGTCLVNANQAGNADYLAAAQVTQSFAVTKNDQTITFNSTAPSAATYLGATYNVTATASSGLTVALAVDASSSTVCSLSGSTVSFIGVGTCTINANQAGNFAFNAAPQVQQSFSVGKASQTITFGALGGKTFGNAPFGVSATASSGLTPTFTSATTPVCTVSGTTVTIVAAGTCTINADQAGNGLYNAASQVQQSFTVAKANQTIAFQLPFPGTATVGGPTFTPAATGGASGNPVTFTIDATATSICSISGGVVSFQAVGTCRINANQAGDANYNAATQIQQFGTVAKGSQTITFIQPTSPVSAATSAALTFSSTSGLTVTMTPTDATVCSVTGTTVNYLKAGSCVLTASQAGDANYNAATSVPRTVTVNLASQSITFNQPTTPANAGTSTTVSPTSTSGLNVALTTTSPGTICTVTGGPVTYTVNYIGAGNCVLNANQAGNATYATATQVQRTVVVTAPFAITNRTSGSPQNTTTVTGTGTVGATVTVYVCNGTQSGCNASGPSLVSNPNFTNPQTATVNGSGVWAVTFSKLSSGAATFTVQAFQNSPSANALLVFSVT